MEYRIEITSFSFVTLESVIIQREINQHATAKIVGVISDRNAEQYRQMLLRDTWVQVLAIDENEDATVIMTGVVAGFRLDARMHEQVLALQIKSGTYLMDGLPHFRTFQKDTQTLMDVLERVTNDYDRPGIIGAEATYTQMGSFLMQYQESDWAFIKRLASWLGLFITPSIVREGVIFYCGQLNRERYLLPSAAHFVTQKHVGDFMRESASGLGSQNERDYQEYIITSREIYDLWDYLQFDSVGGYIYKIHSQYQGQEIVHTYHLCTQTGMEQIAHFNTVQTGCSFEAIVRAVKDDLVQVDVVGDENGDQDIDHWFPFSTVYSSPSGSGWYCMPEIGDHVRLYIPGMNEGQAYVISAVHKETDAARKNPDYKSIKTIYGKELLMTPERIILTNNDGMSLELIDGEGINLISDKDISIRSAGEMTLTSDEGALRITGATSVDVSQQGASIHLDDNIVFSGNKFRIQ